MLRRVGSGAREAGKPAWHCRRNPGRRGPVREQCIGNEYGEKWQMSGTGWNALDFMTSRMEEKEREITDVT